MATRLVAGIKKAAEAFGLNPITDEQIKAVRMSPSDAEALRGECAPRQTTDEWLMYQQNVSFPIIIDSSVGDGKVDVEFV